MYSTQSRSFFKSTRLTLNSSGIMAPAVIHGFIDDIGTTRLRSKRVPCCFGAEKD